MSNSPDDFLEEAYEDRTYLEDDEYLDEDEDEDEDWDDPMQMDAHTLASIGWGTDEDYGFYGE